MGAAASGPMALCLGTGDEVNRHSIDLRALGEQQWVILDVGVWTQVLSPLYQRPSFLVVN